MKEKVGFVGLGNAMEGMNCGYWLAEKLVQEGLKVYLYDESIEKMNALAKKGGIVCESPAAAAAKATVIFIVRTFTEEVEKDLFGEEGIYSTIRPGSVVMDLTSSAPEKEYEFAEKMKEKQVEMLDGPMNGGSHRARDEKSWVNMLVGGSDAAFERVKPFLDIIAGVVVRVGDKCGDGQTAKVATQMVNAITIQALCEGLIYGSKMGVSAAKIREAILTRFIDETLFEVHSMRPIDHNFDGFYIWEHQKDLNYALKAGRKHGISLPATALVQEQFNAVVGQGGKDLDHCALITVLERNSGYEIPKDPELKMDWDYLLKEYGKMNTENLYRLLKNSEKYGTNG